MLGRQINTTYATKTEIPKKVSDLNDDVGIVHLGENNTARDVSLRYGSVKTQIYNSGMTVAKDSSYNSTYLNYGYGQVIDENGKGTLYVGNGIGIYYDSTNNDKPTIKLGDNTVVDDYYLGNTLSAYALKTEVQYEINNAIGNVLTTEDF